MTAAEAEAELARIGHDLRPLDIVLVRTGRDRFYAELDYIARGPGVTAEATHWLFERGVQGHGHRRLGLGRAAAHAGRARQELRPSRASSGRRIRPTCPTRSSSG